MEVEYYKFTKSMIKVSKKFLSNPILNFLNPDFEMETSEINTRYSKKTSHIKAKSLFENSQNKFLKLTENLKDLMAEP